MISACNSKFTNAMFGSYFLPDGIWNKNASTFSNLRILKKLKRQNVLH